MYIYIENNNFIPLKDIILIIEHSDFVKDKKNRDYLNKYRKIIKDSGHSSIDLCDYGYCLSVHKSQGSEFKKVVVFQERSYYWDDEYMKKWLYTASSRAKEKLFIIE